MGGNKKPSPVFWRGFGNLQYQASSTTRVNHIQQKFSLQNQWVGTSEMHELLCLPALLGTTQNFPSTETTQPRCLLQDYQQPHLITLLKIQLGKTIIDVDIQAIYPGRMKICSNSIIVLFLRGQDCTQPHQRECVCRIPEDRFSIKFRCFTWISSRFVERSSRCEGPGTDGIDLQQPRKNTIRESAFSPGKEALRHIQ